MAVDPIISDLQHMMDTNQDVDILNFYKSFPITCKANVTGIERDVVILKVQPPGSICLESQEQTVILSKGFPEAVKAKIVLFDLVTGILKLNDLSFVGSRFGERMIARVQPDKTIYVTLEIEGKKLNGELVDVSLSGIGVIITGFIAQRGQIVDLTLPLPEGVIKLPGKIINLNEAPGGFTRLSIGFTRNAQEIAVVMRYIKDRRVEILAEIEQMYERTCQERKKQSGASSS